MSKQASRARTAVNAGTLQADCGKTTGNTARTRTGTLWEKESAKTAQNMSAWSVSGILCRPASYSKTACRLRWSPISSPWPISFGVFPQSCSTQADFRQRLPEALECQPGALRAVFPKPPTWSRTREAACRRRAATGN